MQSLAVQTRKGSGPDTHIGHELAARDTFVVPKGVSLKFNFFKGFYKVIDDVILLLSVCSLGWIPTTGL